MRKAAFAASFVLLACRGGGGGVGGNTEGDGTNATTVTPTGGGSTVASTGGATEATTGSSSDGYSNDGVPPEPDLVSPADNEGDLPIETELCWEPVEDPDGDEVRYRVFVDGMELAQGELGEEEGYAGPCTGPLNFNYEQSYVWEVQAFEAQDPTRQSERSDAWSFTTQTDGFTRSVFEDDFNEDLGWELTGDATSGVWRRGNPAVALHMGERSQSSVCGWGENCYFTGQNLTGVPEDEDVSGGSTILTSPEFDLTDAAAATVEVTRWFYKSEAEDGPAFRVELLVPDAGEPEGYAVHELEVVDAPTTEVAANLWTPVEYAVCGVPMGPGNRLRITATDTGSGVVEAGIDQVEVHAHDFATVCGSGEGGICDPNAGDTACPDDLLCCSRGALNKGVFRCIPEAAGLDYGSPPGDPADPGNGTRGCDAPDLTIDPADIDPRFSEIVMNEGSCELLEGCVDAVGTRRVMRFALSTPNIGSRDLVLGVAANNPEVYHFSECHNHYHFDEYARYELRDGDEVVARGHKQAFCLVDSFGFAWPVELPTYDCANQGISRGWGDTYGDFLACQWIDVTDVAPGDYTLFATLNQPRIDSAYPTLNEMDYSNNTIAVPVTVE